MTVFSKVEYPLSKVEYTFSFLVDSARRGRLETIYEESEGQLGTPGLCQDCQDPGELSRNADLCEKLKDKLQNGSKLDRQQVLAWLAPGISLLSLSPVSSELARLSVQMAMTAALRESLWKHLAPCLRELSRSPWGHEVLCTVIEYFPTDSLRFLLTWIVQEGVLGFANGRYSAQVLERVMEHFAEEQLVDVSRVLTDAADALAIQRYGNFIVQVLVARGSESTRNAIFQKLQPRLPFFALHKYGCWVVRRCFEHADWHGQVTITRAIIESGAFSRLAVHRCGYVFFEVMEDCDEAHEIVRGYLEEQQHWLCRSRIGRFRLEQFGISRTISKTH